MAGRLTTYLNQGAAGMGNTKFAAEIGDPSNEVLHCPPLLVQ